MKARKLTPEILDSLAPDHPDAIRSRRDLRMINLLMGNFSWMGDRVKTGRWLELGAGDGGFAQDFLRKGVAYEALDLAPAPEGWDDSRVWHRCDLMEFFASTPHKYDGICANLFLHHFTDEQLAELGPRLAASAERLVFSEPFRWGFFHSSSRILFPFVNSVTRHDMVVSIEAGFRGNELFRTLGLPADEWECRVGWTILGAYRFEAWRRS
ncbi:MAG: methyltransferase domain-containing protein [Verrucomicrobiota bacterium]